MHNPNSCDTESPWLKGWDRCKNMRILSCPRTLNPCCEGWISPPGLVGDEIDISRSFGFYHLMPIVNARPDIVAYDLTDADEFIIMLFINPPLSFSTTLAS
ncbi:hypothetical protein B0H16DRAFT_233877 [Mycena metata]|uniref:PPM-type phosphatase domain-containing protein n=1 Tax=Mycena metata TaxID=1033252 RepID=A0AAD7JR43_9AGAR|nr:hypothetical protein B0H16DRAFT_233877 [Mycena metata]